MIAQNIFVSGLINIGIQKIRLDSQNTVAFESVPNVVYHHHHLFPAQRHPHSTCTIVKLDKKGLIVY